MRAPSDAQATITRVLIALVVIVPLVLAMASPLQSYRSWPYIIGGLAGVLAYSLLFAQPLLATGRVFRRHPARQRRWHRRVGTLLVIAVGLHVIGLFLASPPDMLDALMLVAPTPFSLYGVIALWSTVLIGLTAALRGWMRRRRQLWNRVHRLLGVVLIPSSVVHALMIDGAMQSHTKQVVSVLIIGALLFVLPRLWQR